MWRGTLAGVAGVAVMTVAEKLEQRVTGRPDSYMPAHTWERLLRLPHRPDNQRRVLNLGMHFAQGAVLGAWRGVMAEGGLRGWRASAAFTVLRLATDQTLENVTGAGSPPWTWPRTELLIDVAHKVVYAFTTGFVTDRLAERTPGVRAGAGDENRTRTVSLGS